jgi:hypothetical protein
MRFGERCCVATEVARSVLESVGDPITQLELDQSHDEQFSANDRREQRAPH